MAEVGVSEGHDRHVGTGTAADNACRPICDGCLIRPAKVIFLREIMILCPTPGEAILRRVVGLHQAGEPYIQSDETGMFMICMKYGARVTWQAPPDEPRPP